MDKLEVEARAYVESYRDDREGRGFPYLVHALKIIDELREEMKGMFRPVRKERIPFVVEPDDG